MAYSGSNETVDEGWGPGGSFPANRVYNAITMSYSTDPARQLAYLLLTAMVEVRRVERAAKQHSDSAEELIEQCAEASAPAGDCLVDGLESGSSADQSCQESASSDTTTVS